MLHLVYESSSHNQTHAVGQSARNEIVLSVSNG